LSPQGSRSEGDGGSSLPTVQGFTLEQKPVGIAPEETCDRARKYYFWSCASYLHSVRRSSGFRDIRNFPNGRREPGGRVLYYSIHRGACRNNNNNNNSAAAGTRRRLRNRRRRRGNSRAAVSVRSPPSYHHRRARLFVVAAAASSVSSTTSVCVCSTRFCVFVTRDFFRRVSSSVLANNCFAYRVR